MVVQIRPARADDAAALASLTEAAIRSTYGPIAQAVVYEAVIAQTCTEAAFAASIAGIHDQTVGCFLVAEEGAALVGFLDFGGDGDGLELRRLYTAADETGRGIGAWLLSRLEDQLAPGAEYRAIVHIANERGLKFWMRHGFVPVGEVDTRQHFAAHRKLSLTDGEPEPSLVLHRVVGAPF